MKVQAEVVSNQKAGPDIYLLRLLAPGPARRVRPGQFFMLRTGPGPEPLLARPFSAHGVDSDQVLILYRVVGRGTGLLSRAQVGANLTLWGPLGRGFDLEASRPLLVAGGMGHAPLAFAAQVLEAGGKKAVYLSGGSTREVIEPLEDQLRSRLRYSLADDLGPFLEADPDATGPDQTPRPCVAKATSTEDGSLGKKGLVTELLADILSAYPERFDGVIACGPVAMLKAVIRACPETQVSCQVSLEAPMACGLGACLGCAVPARGGGYVRACQEGPVMDAAQVDWERI
jgi:dihydroorotate dehydrogenase electron transfer subunit